MINVLFPKIKDIIGTTNPIENDSVIDERKQKYIQYTILFFSYLMKIKKSIKIFFMMSHNFYIENIFKFIF